MGNVLAQPQKQQAQIRDLDLPNVVFKDTLGSARFLKTLLCVHDEGGLVVVKVFAKRGDTPGLEGVRQQLLILRVQLSRLPLSHVWPWQSWQEGPSTATLTRQHLAASLYERLSTRPFLRPIEKRWLAFQLLTALAQVHEAGAVHGDLKAENVLLTSWGWLFIADFAPYKPTYLPADNPAEFSFFFDTGGRRRCYLAPERFYTTAATATAPLHGPSSSLAPGSSSSSSSGGPASREAAGEGGGGEGSRDASSSASQPGSQGAAAGQGDVFSLGCTLAELFLDGRAACDLGQLLGYRRQVWDPATQVWEEEGGPIAGLEPDVKALVMHMMQLDPGSRWSARRYLQEWGPMLFPAYFQQVLEPLAASLLPLDTDARIAAIHAALPSVQAAVLSETQPSSGQTPAMQPESR
ncbi:kinase-like domain-containing protein, partial [Haematococcus lacustris]